MKSSGPLSVTLAWCRTRLISTETRLLRWALIFSVGIQLVLSPLTSWSGDTPSFIGAVVSLLYNGNPYATDQYFNPPLQPFLSSPFFAVLTLFETPQRMLPNVAALAPASQATGISSIIPAAPALLALKLPLLGAVVVAGLCVFVLAESFVSSRRAQLLAASWLLNPLVIWASAVHGEADVLGVACVLLFLIAARKGWMLLAGIVFGLGIMAGAYPVVLLPICAVSVALLNNESAVRHYISDTLTYLAGVGISILPFLRYVGTLRSLYSSLYPSSPYGGISVLILYSKANFPLGAKLSPALFSARVAGDLHLSFTLMLVLSIAIGVIAMTVIGLWNDERDESKIMKTFLICCLGPVAAVLLYQTSPQSENLLLVLAIGLLVGALNSRASLWLYWILSGAGLLLYWTLLTPAGFFYPLMVDLGESWVARLNDVVIQYKANTIFPPHNSWVIAGVVGGIAIIAWWAFSTVWALRETLRSARHLRGRVTQ